MTTTDRCIKELKLAGLLEKDGAYDGMLGESVKELLLVFQKQGHSGYSAQATSKIFYDLIRGCPLSPLTAQKDEWIDHSDGLKQNNRIPHVFMENGKAYTQQGKVFSDDGGKTYFQNKDSRVYFDLPGYPPETEYVILPDGEKLIQGNEK